MEKNRNTDQRFRDLERNESTLPPTGVWDGIEKNLRSKPAHRSGMILLLFIAVAGAGAIWMGLDKQDKVTEQTNYADNLVQADAPVKEVVQTLSEQNVKDANSNSEDLDLATDEKSKLEKPTFLSLTKPVKIAEKTSPKILSNEDAEPILFTDEDPVKPVASAGQSAEYLGIDATIPEAKFTPEDEVIVYDYAEVAENTPNEKDESLQSNLPSSQNTTLSRRKRNAYFVEGSLGIGFQSKSLSPEGSLTTLRNESESAWYTWSGSVSAGLNFTKRVYGLTTINWSQQKDQFYYRRDSINKLIIEKGQGEIGNTQQITYISEGEIRYSTVNGIVQLGYRINNPKKHRIKLAVEGGLMYNMLLRTNGKLLIDEYTVSRVENEGIYKSSLGIGFAAQLVLEADLTQNSSILLKPYFNSYLTNWNVDEYPLEMRSRHFGTQLSVRRAF